ncbi:MULTISPECIES: hypothetical protein [Pimelobacter]|uniref:hypothetical protein n=1 Tax=Pimelobacter TaxID=2044 RepID=UPI001C0511F8|nr:MULTISPECIES: hypothetical protein [Pimelobacter]MBU2698856.1 hypothetical protein [Pimelobacter sp. 30-1]UUW92986.1 hypothetical protein M0M43_30600 [Pimelobacter simplex]UUW99019.1 hypothetical protein M0M48_30620 [Pimelobacter simplex]
MATTPSKILGYDSRHCDGTPGLEYYIADGDMACAWSGNLHDPIEISLGGYGEPVEHLILVDDLKATGKVPSNLDAALLWFVQVCREWAGTFILANEGNAHPEAIPACVEFDTETSASSQHYIDTGVYMLRATDRRP